MSILLASYLLGSNLPKKIVFAVKHNEVQFMLVVYLASLLKSIVISLHRQTNKHIQKNNISYHPYHLFASATHISDLDFEDIIMLSRVRPYVA